ncbi:MAG: ATP-binding protein [Pyrinomonadaceae bacterium]
MKKLLMSWSGGKDSAMALAELARSVGHEVIALLTTLIEGPDERAQIQHVRGELIERQAALLGLPLRRVSIPKGAANVVYEARLLEALADFRGAGVEAVAFGDLFLADVRAYREGLLGRAGMTGLFPLWEQDTTILLHDFVAGGSKAVVTSVSADVLGRSFAGREVDAEFIAALPAHVDPCGERGEFHTFVYGGPLLGGGEIRFRPGGMTEADGHYFCDLLPA